MSKQNEFDLNPLPGQETANLRNQRKYRKTTVIGIFALGLLSMAVFAAKQVLPESVFTFVTSGVPELAVTADAKTQPTPPQATAAATPPVEQRMTAELILISPRGFEPSTIRRPKGPVLLAMVNRSELPLMTLRLEQVNGSMLRTVEMPRNRRRLSIPMTLEPGRYRIVDIQRPTRSLSLEITE